MVVLNVAEPFSPVPGTLTCTLSAALTLIDTTAWPLVDVVIVVEVPSAEMVPLLNVTPRVVLVNVTGIPGRSLATACTVAVIDT